jgi:VWFA-related protein
MRRELALFFSIATCIVSSAAQETPQAGTPVFQSGTKMVLVPVVVRDRDGRAVSDLTRDSFQVFDKGKQQPIAAFSVERNDTAGASSPAPSQFIGYFFDDVSLHDFGTVMPIREAALR